MRVGRHKHVYRETGEWIQASWAKGNWQGKAFIVRGKKEVCGCGNMRINPDSPGLSPVEVECWEQPVKENT